MLPGCVFKVGCWDVYERKNAEIILHFMHLFEFK